MHHVCLNSFLLSFGRKTREVARNSLRNSIAIIAVRDVEMELAASSCVGIV